MRSDIVWADGWGNTRSALRNVIAAPREDGRQDVWGLIERVLQPGACLGRGAISEAWYVCYRAPDDYYLVKAAGTPEQAIKKAWEQR